MRIDAHVTSGFDELRDIYLRNRFDGCIAIVDRPIAHPQIVALAARLDSLRHFEMSDPVKAISADCGSVGAFEEARLRGLPLDLSVMPDEELLASYPDVRVGMRVHSDLLRLATHPNMYAKLIVTMETRTLAWETLRVFGVERCMFASGWPTCGPWKPTLAAFTQACGPLPQAARERLLGGTAAEFYRI